MNRLLAVMLLWSLSYTSLSAQTRSITEHIVHDNETVYSIAQRYGTTVDKVFELNPWAKTNIKAGDKLIIRLGANYRAGSTTQTSESNPPKGNRQHTIEAGETLYRIARNYNVTEDDIIIANPGISAYNFPIGMVIQIPRPRTNAIAGYTTAHDSLSTSVENPREIDRVKVLLMLPFRKATRYLEFYQGFLMGMNDLKKDGISIHLTALEADDDEAVTNHIFSGAIQNHDLIIGGVTEEQTRLLAQANRMGMYIVPFSGVHNIDNNRLIQINQSPSEVIARVIPEFISRYRNKTIILARRNEDSDDAFTARLKPALRDANVNYQIVNISNTALSLMDRNAVIVPVTADKALAEAVMRSLGSNRNSSVFGYPQWQSFGDTFLKLAHEHNTTIYTTFYFDKNTSESKQFLTKFNAWYNKKVTDSYPKYSVLGYDIARYFIRAHAAYGNSFISSGTRLPSDGLQMDIEIERSQSHAGYTNSRFYFVSFEQDGSTFKQSL